MWQGVGSVAIMVVYGYERGCHNRGVGRGAEYQMGSDVWQGAGSGGFNPTPDVDAYEWGCYTTRPSAGVAKH